MDNELQQTQETAPEDLYEDDDIDTIQQNNIKQLENDQPKTTEAECQCKHSSHPKERTEKHWWKWETTGKKEEYHRR